MDPSVTHVHQLTAQSHGGGDTQKRLLSTPPLEHVEWKRQRMDPGVTAAAEATPSDPRLLPPIGPGAQSSGYVAMALSQAPPTTLPAAGQPNPAGGSASISTPAAGPSSSQGVAPADLPVVEAMIRREGTDKFKRFPFDPTMNAEQRAERVQDERKKICPKSALAKALAGLGAAETFQCDDTVASSLCLLAEHMLEQTMEFGALMASRRQSKWMEVCSLRYSVRIRVSVLACHQHSKINCDATSMPLMLHQIQSSLENLACSQAKDMELYLDRVWQIPLPAFGHRGISAVPKYNPESTDAKYRSAVRAALSALQPAEAPKQPDDKGNSTSLARDDHSEHQND